MQNVARGGTLIEDVTSSEYLLAQKTVEEYRSKGYEVSRGALLDFFPGFRADLIVRKDDEVKVIEVKSRSSLAANPKISELARNYRFEAWMEFRVAFGRRTGETGFAGRRTVV